MLAGPCSISPISEHSRRFATARVPFTRPPEIPNKENSFLLAQGGVYTPTQNFEDDQVGLDEDDVPPGTPPGTPGTTVRRDLVLLSTSAITCSNRHIWQCWCIHNALLPRLLATQ